MAYLVGLLTTFWAEHISSYFMCSSVQFTFEWSNSWVGFLTPVQMFNHDSTIGVASSYGCNHAPAVRKLIIHLCSKTSFMNIYLGPVWHSLYRLRLIWRKHCSNTVAKAGFLSPPLPSHWHRHCSLKPEKPFFLAFPRFATVHVLQWDEKVGERKPAFCYSVATVFLSDKLKPVEAVPNGP